MVGRISVFRNTGTYIYKIPVSCEERTYVFKNIGAYRIANTIRWKLLQRFNVYHYWILSFGLNTDITFKNYVRRIGIPQKEENKQRNFKNSIIKKCYNKIDFLVVCQSKTAAFPRWPHDRARDHINKSRRSYTEA